MQTVTKGLASAAQPAQKEPQSLKDDPLQLHLFRRLRGRLWRWPRGRAHRCAEEGQRGGQAARGKCGFGFRGGALLHDWVRGMQVVALACQQWTARPQPVRARCSGLGPPWAAHAHVCRRTKRTLPSRRVPPPRFLCACTPAPLEGRSGRPQHRRSCRPCGKRPHPPSRTRAPALMLSAGRAVDA